MYEIIIEYWKNLKEFYIYQSIKNEIRKNHYDVSIEKLYDFRDPEFLKNFNKMKGRSKLSMKKANVNSVVWEVDGGDPKDEGAKCAIISIFEKKDELGL